MGTKESKRFDMDPDTDGLWEQVKGDVHRRLSKEQGNGAAIRIVSRLDLDMARRDPEGLARAIQRLKLEDVGIMT